MQRKLAYLLAGLVALVVLSGCTAEVRDNDNQTDTTEVSGGGSARSTPGFEVVAIFAAVGTAAMVMALRKRS